jgi:hypothetical protein
LGHRTTTHHASQFGAGTVLDVALDAALAEGVGARKHAWITFTALLALEGVATNATFGYWTRRGHRRGGCFARSWTARRDHRRGDERRRGGRFRTCSDATASSSTRSRAIGHRLCSSGTGRHHRSSTPRFGRHAAESNAHIGM